MSWLLGDATIVEKLWEICQKWSREPNMEKDEEGTRAKEDCADRKTTVKKSVGKSFLAHVLPHYLLFDPYHLFYSLVLFNIFVDNKWLFAKGYQCLDSWVMLFSVVEKITRIVLRRDIKDDREWSMRKMEREQEPKKTVPTERRWIVRNQPASRSWLMFHSLSLHALFLRSK